MDWKDAAWNAVKKPSPRRLGNPWSECPESAGGVGEKKWGRLLVVAWTSQSFALIWRIWPWRGPPQIDRRRPSVVSDGNSSDSQVVTSKGRGKRKPSKGRKKLSNGRFRWLSLSLSRGQIIVTAPSRHELCSRFLFTFSPHPYLKTSRTKTKSGTRQYPDWSMEPPITHQPIRCGHLATLESVSRRFYCFFSECQEIDFYGRLFSNVNFITVILVSRRFFFSVNQHSVVRNPCLTNISPVLTKIDTAKKPASIVKLLMGFTRFKIEILRIDFH